MNYLIVWQNVIYACHFPGFLANVLLDMKYGHIGEKGMLYGYGVHPAPYRLERAGLSLQECGQGYFLFLPQSGKGWIA